MKRIEGNIIELAKSGEFTALIHACNCYCNMERGISREIRRHFRPAYLEDCKTTIGDESKLGGYTFAKIPDTNLTVVNAYFQFNFVAPGNYFDYTAVSSFLKLFKRHFAEHKIAYPVLSTDPLDHETWDLVGKMIMHEFEGLDHTLVV